MQDFDLNFYNYELPADKIAQKPLEKRDSSKLLLYQKGVISETTFNQINDFLPESSFLFFNDTKVIPARICFQKDTGALIEIFLLEPLKPSKDFATAMLAKNACTWRALIGNKKRFKQSIQKEIVVANKTLLLEFSHNNEDEVTFSWNDNTLTFNEILEYLGQIPLPPYIKRTLQKSDNERYQTVFAKHKGAVAAPTASLHFTEEILQKLNKKNIQYDFLTLHVGAGTFQPIKELEDFRKHTMHAESIVITKKNVENIIHCIEQKQLIIAVGTTALRTLESLYWFGVKILNSPEKEFSEIEVAKLDPYQLPQIATIDAIRALWDFMEKKQYTELVGKTEIFIFPTYIFRVVGGLITNFHLPKTTLVLLVAALIGEDWRKVYQYALENNYRFLSYGDSSLLLP
ncbi:MAG: S-adenosylmethionine:tRNA ribosyltransferase-isomerase [Thermonemataceae bacterium]|nr:S-adenosylmethionine:tRNA ribosyltransferase-isomerase [Thermonemataceae bacterium]